MVFFSRFSSCFAGSNLMLWVQASSDHETDFSAADALLPSASPAAKAATQGRNFIRREIAGFMTTPPFAQRLREGG
jgi:hypothetical protein